MIPWYAWAAGIVAVEAVTEILIHGYPFEWLRTWATRHKFWKSLFECGWCLSLWVAVPVSAVILAGGWVILMPLVIHRLSGAFHYGMNIIREKRWEKTDAL